MSQIDARHMLQWFKQLSAGNGFRRQLSQSIYSLRIESTGAAAAAANFTGGTDVSFKFLAGATTAFLLPIPIPIDYDDSLRVSNVPSGDFLNVRLYMANAGAVARVITPTVSVVRPDGTDAPSIADPAVLSLPGDSTKRAYDIDLSGNGLRADDVVHITLTPDSAAVQTDLFNLRVEIKSNLVATDIASR